MRLEQILGMLCAGWMLAGLVVFFVAVRRAPEREDWER